MKKKIMKTNIRKAMLKDLKQLEKISYKIFPDEDVFLIVNSMIETEHFYILEETIQKKIIGFAIFGLYKTKIAHIFILAIDPQYQKQGFGTILLEHTQEIIKKTHVTKIRLEVRINNKQAIQFYEKHGYQIKETIEKYYEDGSDAYLMVKKIKNEN
jgi:ribosomal-protein-alanine N-acetyltransferase